MGAVEIRRGTKDDLAAVRSLWLSVHAQHQRSMPELAPYVSDETSWLHRSALYASLFERYEHCCLLLGYDGTDLVAYGLAYAQPVADSWLADTWQSGPMIGEIESLAVHPDYRGLGIGSGILRDLHAYLADIGVTDTVIGVLPGNTAATRLYERWGYAPTWLYLSRLHHQADGEAPRERR